MQLVVYEDFQTAEAYLGISQALEEWSDADQTDVVVPHHSPLLCMTIWSTLAAGNNIVIKFEGILKY